MVLLISMRVLAVKTPGATGGRFVYSEMVRVDWMARSRTMRRGLESAIFGERKKQNDVR